MQHSAVICNEAVRPRHLSGTNTRTGCEDVRELGMNEADTCRKLVIPALQAAGWDHEPARICEQVTFTDGRIVVVGHQARRRPGKRADFVLRYRADMPLATVEAKPDGSPKLLEKKP